MSWRELLKPETATEYTKASIVPKHTTSDALVYQNKKDRSKESKSLPPLTIEQRWAIGHWLNTIKEHEPDHRAIVQQQCETDPSAREWYLSKADKTPVQHRRTCLQCRRWRKRSCTSEAIDRARTDPPAELGRCLDYLPRNGDPDLRRGIARWPELLL